MPCPTFACLRTSGGSGISHAPFGAEFSTSPGTGWQWEASCGVLSQWGLLRGLHVLQLERVGLTLSALGHLCSVSERRSGASRGDTGHPRGARPGHVMDLRHWYSWAISQRKHAAWAFWSWRGGQAIASGETPPGRQGGRDGSDWIGGCFGRTTRSIRLPPHPYIFAPFRDSSLPPTMQCNPTCSHNEALHQPKEKLKEGGREGGREGNGGWMVEMLRFLRLQQDGGGVGTRPRYGGAFCLLQTRVRAV